MIQLLPQQALFQIDVEYVHLDLLGMLYVEIIKTPYDLTICHRADRGFDLRMVDTAEFLTRILDDSSSIIRGGQTDLSRSEDPCTSNHYQVAKQIRTGIRRSAT